MMREAFFDTDSVSVSVSDSSIGMEPMASKKAAKNAPSPSPSIERDKLDRALIDSLRNIFSQAQQIGWDGYDAAPVSAATLRYALQFLDFLPLEAGLPEIGVDVDGDITFDWDFGTRRIFSVRVSKGGILYYAGLFGRATSYGREMLQYGIPDEIARGINRAIHKS
jgi:hypothetical protein